MTEYISREEAIKELREVYEQEYPTASGDFDEYASHDVPNVLRNIPSAGVQPVKHGKWKHIAGMNSKCSVCSHYFPVTEFDSRPFDINYCPHCGARMDDDAE